VTINSGTPDVATASRRLRFARLDRLLVALLIATFLTCSLGWLFKAHCTFDDGG